METIKIQASLALSQAAFAASDVHVLLPGDCFSLSSYAWLLSTTVYGLYIANNSFRVQANGLLYKIEFICISQIPQLFLLKNTFQRIAMACTIVYIIFLFSTLATVSPVIGKITKFCKLGTVSQGLALLLFLV